MLALSAIPITVAAKSIPPQSHTKTTPTRGEGVVTKAGLTEAL